MEQISYPFPIFSVFAFHARSVKVFKSLIQVDRIGVEVVGSAVGRIFDIIEYRASRIDRFWPFLKTEYLYI